MTDEQTSAVVVLKEILEVLQMQLAEILRVQKEILTVLEGKKS